MTCSIKTYKIHTNGTDVTFSKRIVRETKQQTRFANTRITNQNQLEEEVTERSLERGTAGDEEGEMVRRYWLNRVHSGALQQKYNPGVWGGGDELTNLFVGPWELERSVQSGFF